MELSVSETWVKGKRKMTPLTFTDSITPPPVSWQVQGKKRPPPLDSGWDRSLGCLRNPPPLQTEAGGQTESEQVGGGMFLFLLVFSASLAALWNQANQGGLGQLSSSRLEMILTLNTLAVGMVVVHDTSA